MEFDAKFVVSDLSPYTRIPPFFHQGMSFGCCDLYQPISAQWKGESIGENMEEKSSRVPMANVILTTHPRLENVDAVLFTENYYGTLFTMHGRGYACRALVHEWTFAKKFTWTNSIFSMGSFLLRIINTTMYMLWIGSIVSAIEDETLYRSVKHCIKIF